MKIGIYDPYLDDLGGGEKYMMTIASCLSRENQVTVFWDNREDIESIQKRFSLNLSQIKIAKNIFNSDINSLKRILTTKNFDVIIILSDGSIPFSLSKKLFIHIQQPLQTIEKKPFITTFKLSRVSGILCNSLFTKSFIEKKFRLHTDLLYPPVDMNTSLQKKENIILHVGRFRVKNVSIGDYKKQGVMIEVFKKMISNGLKDWKFFLAVSINEKNRHEFEKLRQETSGFPIEFYINQTNTELFNLYAKAKIYWHATGFGEDLQKHPEYAEHFGISTVEAMGSGCVPVVINAGGQREIISDGKNGLLWQSENEFIQKTTKVMKDKNLWKLLSRGAIKRAKDFSVERFCQELYRIIQ